MLVSCKVCRREYVASKRPSGEQFVCSRCQGRNRDVNTRLGLHPALERKWANSKADFLPDASRKPGTQHAQSTRVHSDGKRTMIGESSMPKIPGFELSYQIGRGAMGSVYRARQVKTGQLVAIKVLSNELSERADLVARFEREAYALKSLNNPNVVTIIDAGHVEHTHYFAMEFIDGITLRTRISRGTVDIEEACFITAQMLNGLKAAHKHGIIHRDLKPENVLLAYDGRDFMSLPSRVVLVDFGLVGIGGLAFDPHPNLTRSRVTMGTVNYMAPEQHIDAKRVDHRSDLYSAGVIFFEMLTGELPLGRYLLPKERGMDLPAEVDEVLSKALSRNVEERYSAAEKFFEDVVAISERVKFLKDPGMNAKHEHDGDLSSLVKGLFQRTRFAWLLIIAGVFFALGIKFSASDDESGQHVRAQKVLLNDQPQPKTPVKAPAAPTKKAATKETRAAGTAPKETPRKRS